MPGHMPERQDSRKPASGITLTDGWRLLSYDGCHFAVPGSWQQNADGSAVSAPDGSNLSVRMLRTANWSAHKSQVRAAFGQLSTVHEDSGRRLWFEFGDGSRTQHYIAVTNGARICAGLLETRTKASARDTSEIAASIGPDVGGSSE